MYQVWRLQLGQNKLFETVKLQKDEREKRKCKNLRGRERVERDQKRGGKRGEKIREARKCVWEGRSLSCA